MVKTTKDIHVRFNEDECRKIDELVKHRQEILQTTNRKEVSVASVIRDGLNINYRNMRGENNE